jgi:hypothetical protein
MILVPRGQRGGGSKLTKRKEDRGMMTPYCWITTPLHTGSSL